MTRTGQVLLFVCCRQASYTAGAIVGGIAAAGGRCECIRRSGHLGIASSCQVKPLCRFRGPADTRGRRQPPGQGENCLMIIQDQHHCIGISTTAYHCVGISTTVMGSAPLVMGWDQHHCVGISTTSVCWVKHLYCVLHSFLVGRGDTLARCC